MEHREGQVHEAILRALDRHDKTRDPMNALIIWTELGRALCGTLDKKGADVGLLGRIIDGWCGEKGAAEVDLGRWAYRQEPAQRLGAEELADVLQNVQEEVERVVADLPYGDEGDGGKAAFLTVVRGWFPAGQAIIRALPAAKMAGDAELRGALRAWCARYFPKDPAGPADLGVRMTREG